MLRVNNGYFYRIYKGQKQEILKNINIHLQSGEVLSILGRNGAGKTTLLKCIMGLERFSDGQSLLFGKALSQYTQKALWQQLSYVPQSSKAYTLNLKVLDMVALGLNPFIRTTPSKAHLQSAMEMLESLSLSHLAQKMCLHLSGGELQMVSFARALVKKPRLLILDEPESHLDFYNQKIICQMIQKLSSEGVGIILNTHFPANARLLSSKVCLIYKISALEPPLECLENTNALFGTNAEILTEQYLSALYDVPLYIHKHARKAYMLYI